MTTPRFFVDEPLHAAASALLSLPAGAARHVQVLRLQPGASITLFDGRGGEWDAEVTQIARNAVTVRLAAHHAVERELAHPVTLALGVPANERMDALIEKATELGVATIQPLMCERSVLRLAGERAQKKIAHWQAVAIAACEQSGRTRVPQIAPVQPLAAWLTSAPAMATRWVLSLHASAVPVAEVAAAAAGAVVTLSGPEGGLSAGEEEAALAAGYTPVSLGARVLRADTAPLAVLALLSLRVGAAVPESTRNQE